MQGPEHKNKKTKSDLKLTNQKIEDGNNNKYLQVVKKEFVKFLYYPTEEASKRVVKCGNCGQLGHNIRNPLCPQNLQD